MKTITCFYHGDDCLDGLASAWVVRTHSRKVHNLEPRLHEVNYHNPPPCYPTGILYLVDFIYTDIKVMRQLIESAKKTVVFDHHPQAKAIIEQLNLEYPSEKFYGVFDAERSGCGLAWDVLMNLPRPDFINYIEDYDLWRFKLEHTRMFCEGLRQEILTFKRLNQCLSETYLTQVIEQGRAASERIQAAWERNHTKAQEEHNGPPRIIMGGHKIPLMSIDVPALRSELAQRFLSLLEEPVVGVVWKVGNHTRVRLVSSPDGPDVNIIARAFGGGGHPHASGFLLEDMTPEELLA